MKKIIAILLCVLLAFPQAGCAPGKESAPAREKLITQDELDTTLKATDGLQTVASMGDVKLLVNGKTAAFTVQNVNGTEWSSNPAQPEKDLLAVGENKQALSAQLSLEYYDQKGKISELNSYTDAVELGQYSFAKIDNGVRITYEIGKKKKIYRLPPVISVKRMEALITSKLSDRDRTELLGRYTRYAAEEIDNAERKAELLKEYPHLQKEPIYVLTPRLAEFVMEKLETYIVKTGYTMADRQTDDQENAVVSEEQPASFQIPVDVTLDGGTLLVRVRTADIVYSDSYMLTELRVLPFFGAAGLEETGYMVVPDGSGALIHLNNGKNDLTPYKHVLYGADMVMTPQAQNKLSASLPIFGMKQTNRAFLAVIESGDALASVNARVSRYTNSYNSVFSSFSLTQRMAMTNSFQDSGEINVYQAERFTEDLTVRYCFLEGTAATYTGMARTYQQRLLNAGELRQAAATAPTLYLELLGAVEYHDSLLGIPITATKALTTFDEARSLLTQLREGGVSEIALQYDAWANGGINHTLMTSVRPQKQLGGKKGLANLQSWLTENGLSGYFDWQIQSFDHNTLFDGYTQVADAPKNILGEVAVLPRYDPASDVKKGKRLLIRPTNYSAYAEKSIKSLKKTPLNALAIGDLGTQLYADYKEGAYVSRQQAIREAQEAIHRVSDSGYGLLFRNPQAYALRYAQAVTALPDSSNRFYLTDEDIPFYQIVLHGVIPYAHTALNQQGDYEKSVLKMVEYGANPSVKGMYASNKEVKGVLEDSYALAYTGWMEKVQQTYADTKEILAQTMNSKIAAHEKMGENVYCTRYENGMAVYVNYGKQPATVADVTIAAGGYEARKG